MRIEIDESVDMGDERIFGIVANLKKAVMPKTDSDKEYVVVIKNEEVHIFWATVGKSCRCMKGSVIMQDNNGSRKINWFDIFIDEKDIATYVRNKIEKYWEYENHISNKQMSMIYAPLTSVEEHNKFG